MSAIQDADLDVQDDIYEHYRVVVDAGQELLRIDKFLFDRLANVSRTRVSDAARNGNILVNGLPQKQNYRVKPGDEVSIVFPHPKRELELLPENIPLNIVYEDDDLVVIDKPAGLVVHPGHGNYTGTLVNALLYHFENLPQNKKNPDAYPGLVHRIDKDTSGLLLVAKTDDASNKLAAQFFHRTIQRNYIALVWGNVVDDRGTIEGHIGRSTSDRMLMTVYPDASHGKPAITHYEVLERFSYVTLVRCKLESGRTHQIRVHMKHIGHPLFGDPRYGGDRIVKGTTFAKYRQFVENCFTLLPRQALHAQTLGFIHPSTGKEMFFKSEIPDDLDTVLDRWRDYIKSSSH